MKDLDYLSAIERQYLMAHPDRVEWIADLAPEDYAMILREWPTTEEGRRFMSGADEDRLGEASPPDTSIPPRDSPTT